MRKREGHLFRLNGGLYGDLKRKGTYVIAGYGKNNATYGYFLYHNCRGFYVYSYYVRNKGLRVLAGDLTDLRGDQSFARRLIFLRIMIVFRLRYKGKGLGLRTKLLYFLRTLVNNKGQFLNGTCKGYGYHALSVIDSNFVCCNILP